MRRIRIERPLRRRAPEAMPPTPSMLGSSRSIHWCSVRDPTVFMRDTGGRITTRGHEDDDRRRDRRHLRTGGSFLREPPCRPGDSVRDR